MKKIFNITVGFLLSFYSAHIWAYSSFPDQNLFRRNKNNPAVDSFCPRLEGQYPNACCPYQQNGPIKCYYYDQKQIDIGTVSSATSCVSGSNQTVTCCDVASVTCNENISNKDFIQRLIKRKESSSAQLKCGFEACPYPEYWKTTTGLGKSVSRQDPSNQKCTVVQSQDQCASNSNMPRCSQFSACPPPPEPPTTPPTTPPVEPPANPGSGSGSGSGSGTGSGTGGPAVEDPGPVTNPPTTVPNTDTGSQPPAAEEPPQD